MENCCTNFERNIVPYCCNSIISLTDETVKTEDGCSFPVHKFIISRRSQFFYCLFRVSRNEKEDKEGILIPRIKGVDLSNILSYLYTGDIHVTENNIMSLIVSSDYLQLDDLLFKLKQHLRRNLTPTNGLPLFNISLELHLDEFCIECLRFVQMNFESIVRCEDAKIPEISLATLTALLGDKKLRVRSESIVWLSIIKWVESDTDKRLFFVPYLLKHLAISDIDENVADEILQHDIVAKNPFCQEIHNLKTVIPDANNLVILQRYFQTQIRPFTALCDRRQPSKLNLIACYNTDVRSDGIPIYATYDEDIDLWRKLTEARGRYGTLLSVNDCIYMFQRNRIQCYSITEKHWSDVAFPRMQRFNYEIVALDGCIYVLGGLSHAIGGPTRAPAEVEVYDCETGEWRFTSPMLPAEPLHAIVINNIIYTLGRRNNEMVAQAFDPTSKTWNALPSAPSVRLNFTMVTYRGMIYVIGGVNTNHQFIKDVEVFDPDKNEWYTEVNLPNAYRVSTAVVINDKLIVYDNSSSSYSVIHPPVQWNVHQRCWETLENPSMKDLKLYAILTIERSEFINTISRESKDPAIGFERSPFS